MSSLIEVLELVGDARNYLESGKVNDAAFLLEVIEHHLADLLGSVDQLRSLPPNSP